MVVRDAVPSASAGAASGNVCPLDDAAEPFVGVVVAPDDVAADHAGLLLMAGVVSAVAAELQERVRVLRGLMCPYSLSSPSSRAANSCRTPAVGR
jgi:hypothetical protein